MKEKQDESPATPKKPSNEFRVDSEIMTFDPENSDVRNNNQFYTNNLYNQSDSLTPQENLKENLLEKPESELSHKNEIQEKKESPIESCKDSSKETSSDSSDKQENMDFNLKTTIAHLQSDLIYSIGVFISAVLINIFPDKLYFDSICTFLFSYVALELTIPIYKESVRILLEGPAEGSQPGDTG